jgi:hypothetical protein
MPVQSHWFHITILPIKSRENAAEKLHGSLNLNSRNDNLVFFWTSPAFPLRNPGKNKFLLSRDFRLNYDRRNRYYLHQDQQSTSVFTRQKLADYDSYTDYLFENLISVGSSQRWQFCDEIVTVLRLPILSIGNQSW